MQKFRRYSHLLVCAGAGLLGILASGCATASETEGVADQGLSESPDSSSSLPNEACKGLSADLKKKAAAFIQRGDAVLQFADCGPESDYCNGEPPSSQVLLVCPLPLGSERYGTCTVGLSAGSVWSLNFTSVTLAPPNVAPFLSCIGRDV